MPPGYHLRPEVPRRRRRGCCGRLGASSWWIPAVGSSVPVRLALWDARCDWARPPSRSLRRAIPRLDRPGAAEDRVVGRRGLPQADDRPPPPSRRASEPLGAPRSPTSGASWGDHPGGSCRHPSGRGPPAYPFDPHRPALSVLLPTNGGTSVRGTRCPDDGRRQAYPFFLFLVSSAWASLRAPPVHEARSHPFLCVLDFLWVVEVDPRLVLDAEGHL